MSTETKLVIGIILVSIGVTFLGIKLAYRPAAEPTLALSADLLNNPASPRLTGASSTISIVEFADFECPACGAMQPIFKQLLKDEGSKITFVFRNFLIHENADKFAIAALAAGKQGKFWEMHDMMFDNQDEWSDISLDKQMAIFAGYAQKLGLDMTKYQADLGDKTLADLVAKDQHDGVAMGINATPTIIINNNRIIVGGKNYDALKKMVEDEIAKGPVTLK